jgi:undecaprenyl-diphosphatase
LSLAELDLAGYRAIRSLARDPQHIRTAVAFTRLGEHAAIWLAIGAVGSVRSPEWRRATVRIGAAYVVNTALKLAVRRRRPAVDGLPPLVGTPTGLSFPSAHATSSFCAARGFSRLAPAGPFYVLATALVASRLYLGVHYPSDVLAGAALGTVLA